MLIVITVSTTDRHTYETTKRVGRGRLELGFNDFSKDKACLESYSMADVCDDSFQTKGRAENGFCTHTRTLKYDMCITGL